MSICQYIKSQKYIKKEKIKTCIQKIKGKKLINILNVNFLSIILPY